MSCHEVRYFCRSHAPTPAGNSQAPIEDDEQGMSSILCHPNGSLWITFIQVAWNRRVRIKVKSAVLHQLRATSDSLDQLVVRVDLIGQANTIFTVKGSCKPISRVVTSHKRILPLQGRQPVHPGMDCLNCELRSRPCNGTKKSYRHYPNVNGLPQCKRV